MIPLHALFIVLVVVTTSVLGQGIMENTIYYDLPDASPCTKWMNLTHQIGCTTKSSGESGILRFFGSIEEIDEVIKLNQKTNDIAVIYDFLFNSETINKLESFAKGVLILENGSVPIDGHSDDLKFPQYNALSLDEPFYEWNPKGNETLYRLYKIPMWLLNKNDSLVVHKLSQMNKVNRTRWSAQLTQFMHANQDGANCLRLGFCEPVGGHSVWTSLPPNVKKENKFIISTSTIDSISLFHGRSTGAVSDMSGLIANLAALEALSRDSVDMNSFKKQIIFTFFEGENWGYVGSSRFIHNINNFKCLKWNKSNTTCSIPSYRNLDFMNIKLENVDAIVELKQVGTLSKDNDEEENRLYVHRQDHDFDNPLVNLFKNVADDIDQLVLENADNETPGLPPSSSKAFIKYSHVPISHSTVVITDHSGPYKNKFYHSHFDDYRNVDTKLISKSSTLLARSLYSLANDVPYSESKFIEVNHTLVEELTTCLTRNISCNLFSDILPKTKSMRIKTPSHYGGPFFPSSISLTSKFVHDFAYLQMNRTRSINCTKCDEKNYQRCIAGYCISSYVHYHEAYSLAFERDINQNFKIVNPDEPVWLESYWDPIGLRLYRAGNKTNEAIFVIFSLLIVTVTFILSLFGRRKFFGHFKVM